MKVLYCNKLGRSCIDINSLNPKKVNPYWIRKHGSKKKAKQIFSTELFERINNPTNYSFDFIGIVFVETLFQSTSADNEIKFLPQLFSNFMAETCVLFKVTYGSEYFLQTRHVFTPNLYPHYLHPSNKK